MIEVFFIIRKPEKLLNLKTKKAVFIQYGKIATNNKDFKNFLRIASYKILEQ